MKKTIISMIMVLLLLAGCDKKPVSLPKDEMPDIPTLEKAVEINEFEYICIKENGVSFEYKTEDYVWGTPIKAFSDLDTSALKPTDKRVYAVYYHSTPTDAIVPYQKVAATVYELDDKIQNDEHINVIAVKLDGQNDVKLFTSLKDLKKDDTLKFFLDSRSKYFGYMWNSPENIVSIIVDNPMNVNARFFVTDKEKILNIFSKVTSAKIVEDSTISYTDTGCKIIFNFANGDTFTANYNRSKNLINGCFVPSDDFEECIYSLV